MTIQEALVAAGVAEKVEEDEESPVRVEFSQRGEEDVHLQLVGYELSRETVVIELED